MNRLARAIVDTFAFLELSDDDAIDPDVAVKAMEMLTATLRGCNKAELTALRRAAAEALQEQRQAGNNQEALDFYSTFMDEFDE